MTELRNRTNNTDDKPQIIAITEVKPTNSRYPTTEAELQIPGYNIHVDNLDVKEGRGTLIYTADYLKANIEHLQTEYRESILLGTAR